MLFREMKKKVDMRQKSGDADEQRMLKTDEDQLGTIGGGMGGERETA